MSKKELTSGRNKASCRSLDRLEGHRRKSVAQVNLGLERPVAAGSSARAWAALNAQLLPSGKTKHAAFSHTTLQCTSDRTPHSIDSCRQDYGRTMGLWMGSPLPCFAGRLGQEFEGVQSKIAVACETHFAS